MAMYIPGKSVCLLCEGYLVAKDEMVGFSAFLTPEHPLWRMSDAVVHKRCFEFWPYADEFKKIYHAHELWEKAWLGKPENVTNSKAKR